MPRGSYILLLTADFVGGNTVHMFSSSLPFSQRVAIYVGMNCASSFAILYSDEVRHHRRSLNTRSLV